MAWRSFLVRHVLATIPSRGKAKFRTKMPGRANRRDLQARIALGRWTVHPLTRQLFDEVHHGQLIFRLNDGRYKARHRENL